MIVKKKITERIPVTMPPGLSVYFDEESWVFNEKKGIKPKRNWFPTHRMWGVL